MAVFISVQKQEENKKKNEEIKPIFLSLSFFLMFEVILLKFGMWSTNMCGHVHSKNCAILQRQYGATNA